MKAAFHFALVTGLTYLAACSGRTVRLDHEPMGSAGAPDDLDGPTLVYRAPGAPLMDGLLLVDEQRLYWQSSDQAFRSCLKENCRSSIVTYTASSDMDSAGIQLHANIAVSHGQAFWLANPPRGTLYSCPTTGCQKPTRLLRDPALPDGYGLAADGGHVYWLSTKDVYQCAAAGCGNSPARAPFSEGALPVFFGGDAFWIQRSNGSSRIRRAPRDGSAAAVSLVERVDAGFGAIQEIAINARYAYWLDDTSRVLRCPLSGCDAEPDVLEAEAGDKQRLRADERGVYWLDFHEVPEGTGIVQVHDAVHFCANSGCAPSTALGTFDQLDTYALDDDFIYFTARIPRDWGSVGGDIMRMPKPKP